MKTKTTAPIIAALAALAAAPATLAQDAKPAEAAPAAPAAATGEGDVQKFIIGVLPGVMQYDKKEITVTAGKKVAILFTNKACPLQHNLIILKPGTDTAYGAAADSMMAKDPAGALTKGYIPDDPTSTAAVIAKTTKLIGTGQSEKIEFTAPADAGDYPILCTFPGHRFLMKGVMKVTK